VLETTGFQRPRFRVGVSSGEFWSYWSNKETTRARTWPGPWKPRLMTSAVARCIMSLGFKIRLRYSNQ